MADPRPLEPPPPDPDDPDVPLLASLARGAYEIVALLAMLAHLLIVGPLSLLALSLTVPPGSALGGLVLKAIVVVVWVGLGYLGIRAWRRNSWWVVAVPIVSFVLVYSLIRIGNDVVDWSLNIGY